MTRFILLSIILFILEFYGFTRYYRCAKSPTCIMIIGFSMISVSTIYYLTITDFLNTGNPYFSKLTIAKYILSISMAAIGANIVASAFIMRAELAIKKEKMSIFKEIRDRRKIIFDLNQLLTKTNCQVNKLTILNKISEQQEQIDKLKNKIKL